jgi:hypothetical protein
MIFFYDEEPHQGKGPLDPSWVVNPGYPLINKEGKPREDRVSTQSAPKEYIITLMKRIQGFSLQT